METLYFLGIDVAKNMFQAALTVDGISMVEIEVENNAKAIKGYFQGLKTKFKFSSSQLVVCLEHTGIYTYPILDYLATNKIKVCVESAMQIKRSQGIKRGKSDKVDAQRIAQYAFKNFKELRFWKPQRPVLQKLKALLVTRERLIRTKIQLEIPLNEQGYIEESIRRTLTKSCQSTISALARDIKRIEQTIKSLIREDLPLSEQMRLATSVPGIGMITALNIIISTDEFEKITESKKFACYAGVAPFEHTSGSSVRGKTRVSKIANMNMKKLLHMAAISAIQCSQELGAFYQRKVAEGKNKMSVINAVRNKLISRVFVCIKNKHMYEKNYGHALA
jgi:transposase